MQAVCTVKKCSTTRDMSCQPPSSPHPAFHFDPDLPCSPQHASADVEKMILGNKCDVNDKRQVSKERGEKVGAVPRRALLIIYSLGCSFLVFLTS